MTVTAQSPAEAADNVVSVGIEQFAVPALAIVKATAPVPEPPELAKPRAAPKVADVEERPTGAWVPGLMVNTSVADPVPAEFDAEIVTLNVPAFAGVPEI